jgi:hypothetical protein
MHSDCARAFAVRYDAPSGVVRVTREGPLSDGDFVRYRDALAHALHEVRAVTPAARVLVDARGIEALPPNSADRLAEMGRLFSPDDRIAVIVGSSLLKIEARRIAHSASVQNFVSENAAWTWLMAYSVPNTSAA